jgi:hypothetical protein
MGNKSPPRQIGKKGGAFDQKQTTNYQLMANKRKYDLKYFF